METFEKHLGLRATPFLKWAGGKTQLLRAIDRRLPATLGTYFEPFLGGGAVFFHLFTSGRIPNAAISDSNVDLIDSYVAIREELDVLLVHLQELQFHAKEERYFYEVRKRFNEIKRTRSPNEKVEKAALLLYLNKTCFNGLYRVNRKGEFNVPWGDYKNPRIYDKQNLSAVSAILNQPGIKISCQDFSAIERETNEGDFVYFDPPYQPLSKTSHFTSYTSESFSAANQENLSRLFHRLTEKGCYCMLSNSPGVRPLYDGDSYRVEIVKAGRAINSVGTARGPIDELLVLNYGQ